MSPSMEFMNTAIDEACNGVRIGDGGPFGAVVVKDGKIVGQGHNMVLAHNDPTAHAEVTAIRDACKNLNSFQLDGCQLYTSCYPCPMCMGAALWSRVDAIYYAATAEQAADAGFDDKLFHDFLKDPKTDEERKLEVFKMNNTTKPFELWKELEKKIAY